MQPPFPLPPPPPHRRSSGSPMDGLTDSHLNTVPTTKTNEEEGNSEIHVPKKRVKVKNGRSHSYYLRSSKRFESNINSLPDDIVFDILVKIPAQDIYSAVRPVCRKWNQITRTNKFVNTHLHHSTYGLLLQKQVSQSNELAFVSLSRQGQIELTRLGYEPGEEIWCSSCNGLILESEPSKDAVLFISNPVTMQSFPLPPFVFPFPVMNFCYSALAYASLSMVYKVVQVYRTEKQWACSILTVGVDKSWRPVCTQHLSVKANENLRFRPLTTEGFVHWAKSGIYVLTLNVETEIITEYLVPCSGDRHFYFPRHLVPSFDDRFYYFPTARYLSLLIANAGHRSCSWDIWEMKPETGEWTQLPGIYLKGLSSECDTNYKLSHAYNGEHFPVGWLEYKVLLYRVPMGICVAWNIRLKEFEFVEIDFDLEGYFVHRNSLLWLDGC